MLQQQLNSRNTVLVMAGLMISVLLSGLDGSIVGTAMPRIIGDLHGMDLYTWPFTSYMLWSTIAIILFGKISDTHGRKPIFLAGIIIFLVGSMLCGLSQNMTELIIFRGLQGIGGGIGVSVAFTILGDLFPIRERGKYAGMLASMFGLASLVGPLVGGLITDNLSWRWVFYINLPLGLIAIVLIIAALPNFRNEAARRIIDYKGAVILTLALVPLIVALSLAGNTFAWLSWPVTGLLTFSLVMLVAFYFTEKQAIEPVMPLTIYKNPIFNVSVIASFLSSAVMFCGMVYIPLFMQGVAGQSATSSGLILTPAMISLTIASIITGQLIAKTGKYKVWSILGFVIILAGIFPLCTMTAETSALQVLAFSTLLGLGSGMMFPIFSIAVQNVFPPQQLGLVTSSIQFFRNMGAAVGTAICGSILLFNINNGFDGISSATLPPQTVQLLKNPRVLTNPESIAQITSQLSPDVLSECNRILGQAKLVMANSLDMVFLCGVVMAGAGLIAVLLLKEVPLARRQVEIRDDAKITESEIKG